MFVPQVPRFIVPRVATDPFSFRSRECCFVRSVAVHVTVALCLALALCYSASVTHALRVSSLCCTLVTHCQFVPQVRCFIVPRFTQCPFTSVLLSATLRVSNINVIWQLHSLLLHVIWNSNVIWQLHSVLNVIWQLHSVVLHVIWNTNAIWDRTMRWHCSFRCESSS